VLARAAKNQAALDTVRPVPLNHPYTVLSCAISADGCLDDASAQQLILSSPEDLDEVDELRACVDAILVGAGTVRADNPRLLVRSPQRVARRMAAGRAPHPLRVTLTRSGALDPAARFFTGPGDFVVYQGTHLSLRRVLQDLYTERKVTTTLIEGGSGILAEALCDGLADELRLAVAPFFVGDAAAPRFATPGHYPHSAQARMRPLSVHLLGDTAVLHYKLSDREPPAGACPSSLTVAARPPQDIATGVRGTGARRTTHVGDPREDE
jgi:5-amino-6-(5-phosphoribosylamino)uracil reductase